MKIIDADKLHYKQVCIQTEKGPRPALVVFAKEIRKMPEIPKIKAQVDLVKHGHWTIEDIITYERSYGGTLYEPVYKCSCCGRVTESYVRGDEPIMPEDADFPEFCGNCGAKMDEMKVNNSKGIDLWMTKEDFNSLYEDDVEDGV